MKHLDNLHPDRFYSELVDNAFLIHEVVEGEHNPVNYEIILILKTQQMRLRTMEQIYRNMEMPIILKRIRYMSASCIWKIWNVRQ